MRINRVIGREIFDSRGLPTLECELFLNNHQSVRASVPSGASCGHYEAVDLRDGGNRLMGLGVTKAIENLDQQIAPLIVGKEPNLVDMDAAMIALDGTPNKANLGGNTILSASLAIAKAHARALNMQLYEFIAHLCNFESVSIPYPMFNLINGGKHADNNLTIQEIMLVPLGFSTFKEALEATAVVQYTMGKLLHDAGKHRYTGDEGGYCADFADEKEAFDFLMRAVSLAGYKFPDQYMIALDVASSQLYDPSNNTYKWGEQLMTADDLIAYYDQLASHYPIYSIEDGLAEDDWEGWQRMYEKLSDKLQLVGDDLFVTNPQRIIRGLELKVATAAIIKPNQIGTVTEALQALLLCKEQKLNTIVSHRSGETEDTFIVDMAVGSNAGQLKAGGCSRGERMAKYNQLLRIEETLHRTMMGI